MSESEPLLNYSSDQQPLQSNKHHRYQFIQGLVLVVLFIVAVVLALVFQKDLSEWSWTGELSRNPELAAQQLLRLAPVIDGHIDLPIAVRALYVNNASAFDLTKPMPGHVDIPRLRKGRVGAFFWSVYADCPPDSKDFIAPDYAVRDTLEQIDIARILIDKYADTFQLALTASDIRKAINSGKIASMLGAEGAHQIGNSIPALRQFHALGVRYITLTHICHNAFADSCGFTDGLPPLHGGLSKLGRSLIEEMNRIGVIVDLSHTSDDTALQALKLSKAPVMWSHSSARAITDHPRNIPDNVLKHIGFGPDQNDAVVMINFGPIFVGKNASLELVADHVEHVAKIAGKAHVGIGSDFDGIEDVPIGLEDVSKYPALIAELYRRGWDKYELSGLTGANLLRVFDGVERVVEELKIQGAEPSYDYYTKRPDLPLIRS